MRLFTLWLFLLTQVGILLALVGGWRTMVKTNHKLDRDHSDRDLLRSLLISQSNQAREAMEAVNPAEPRDRRLAT